MTTTGLLTSAPRCLLVAPGPGEDRPAVSMAPFWWDGEGLWIPGLAATEELFAALHAGARTIAYVPPARGIPKGTAVKGSALVLGPHDPVTLALYGPALTLVSGALAVKYSAKLGSYVRDLARIHPTHWSVSVARLEAESVEEVDPAPAVRGITPPLPSVIPPAVRRALAGLREVAVVTAKEQPRIDPAVWTADLALHAAVTWPDDVPAAVVVDDGHNGVAIEGRIRRGRLMAEQARWWQGLVTGQGDVPVDAAGVVRMPE